VFKLKAGVKEREKEFVYAPTPIDIPPIFVILMEKLWFIWKFCAFSKPGTEGFPAIVSLMF
jgi:hypothetical protein